MSIGLRWLGLFLLLWCASACLVEGATLGEGDTQLSTLIGSGKELYSQGRLKESEEKFREVVKLDSDNIVANHYLARIEALVGHYKAAVDMVRKLQRLGVSIYRSEDSKTTLNTVMSGILSAKDLKQRAELLIHLRETVQGLPAAIERRIDAHLMAIYAKLGENQLYEVVRSRYFAVKPVSAPVFFTAARTYLEYDVRFAEAANYFEQAIDALGAQEIPPSGNPKTDRDRRKLLDAEMTVAQDFLAYAYRGAKMFAPEKNRLLAAEPQPKVTFTEVTKAAGLKDVKAPRVAVGDFDGDGFEDLCLGGRVFKNNGGKTFTDVTEKAKIDPRGVVAALWLDYDGDGRLDLLAAGFPALRLWRNLGNGTFEDASRKAGFGAQLPGVPEALAATDYDGDGRLDLFIGTFEHPKQPAVGLPDFLLHNNGRGGFDDVSAKAGLRQTAKVLNPNTGKEEERVVSYCARGCAWGDFNDDGKPDLYVANYRLHPNQLWVNQGGGKFVDKAEELGVRGVPGEGRFASAFGHSIGCAWGDLDGDGDLDLVVTNLAMPRFLNFSDVTAVYINGGKDAKWHFADVAAKAGLRYEGMVADVSLADFDSDGDLDLYHTAIYKERPSFLYQNDGSGKFQQVTWRSGTLAFNNWGQAWFDKDNDGDLDLLLGSAAGVHLFENQAKGISWLRVRLVGKRGNRWGIGSRVSIDAGGKRQVREVTAGSGSASQSSAIAHFGLGGYLGAVTVTVRWPDGHTQRVTGVKAKTLVTIKEE